MPLHHLPNRNRRHLHLQYYHVYENVVHRLHPLHRNRNPSLDGDDVGGSDVHLHKFLLLLRHLPHLLPLVFPL